MDIWTKHIRQQEAAETRQRLKRPMSDRQADSFILRGGAVPFKVNEDIVCEGGGILRLNRIGEHAPQ